MSLVGGYFALFTQHDVNWPGFLVVALFYALFFAIGLYASKKQQNSGADQVLLAGRSMPLWVAIFTMSATWIGGGYINGSAEYTAAAGSGLVWVQAPWGYALSLMLGGIIFAGKMRRFRFHTMLDPLEQRFGKKLTAVFFLPALAGDIFWSAAILTALGVTFGTILGLETTPAILLSAGIAIAYTVVGGLWSVAYTDIFQLIILVGGLYFVAPFALASSGGWQETWSAYQALKGPAASLLPSKEALGSHYWQWWDSALLLIFGGIPWQVYFQRVLAAKDVRTARLLSFGAAFICLIAALSPIAIGMVGAVTDWQSLGLPSPPSDSATLPHVLRYLTPPLIGIIGLGAITAAVMSSIDSSILASSSLAGWNVYRPLINPRISSEQLGKVIQKMVVLIGVAVTLLALQVKSVYALWFLCSDFVYCLLFPPLLLALFDPKVNKTGALAGLLVAATLRFGGGEAVLGLPVLLPYPMIEDGIVLFPFKTLSMLSGLVTGMLVSRLTQQWDPPTSLQPVTE